MMLEFMCKMTHCDMPVKSLEAFANVYEVSALTTLYLFLSSSVIAGYNAPSSDSDSLQLVLLRFELDVVRGSSFSSVQLQVAPQSLNLLSAHSALINSTLTLPSHARLDDDDDVYWH